MISQDRIQGQSGDSFCFFLASAHSGRFRALWVLLCWEETLVPCAGWQWEESQQLICAADPVLLHGGNG